MKRNGGWSWDCLMFSTSVGMCIPTYHMHNWRCSNEHSSRVHKFMLCWVLTLSVNVEWWLCDKVAMICVFNLWLFIYCVSDTHDLWDHLITVNAVLGYYRMNVTKWSQLVQGSWRLQLLLRCSQSSFLQYSLPSLCHGDSNCRFIACNQASFSSLPSFAVETPNGSVLYSTATKKAFSELAGFT